MSRGVHKRNWKGRVLVILFAGWTFHSVWWGLRHASFWQDSDAIRLATSVKLPSFLEGALLLSKNDSQTPSDQGVNVPRIQFLDRHLDRSLNCTLPFSATTRPAMHYLGSGYNGQVFSVPLHCDHNQHEKYSFLEHGVVVKLRIFPANASDKIKIRTGRVGTYRSEKKNELGKHDFLYQRMLQGINQDSTEKVLQHFALRIGSVDVPPFFLHQAVESSNQFLSMRTSYRLMQYPVPDYPHHGVGHQEASIRAQVYSRLPTDVQTLRAVAQAAPPVAVRQSVVRDLIWMYRHMYQHNLVVCDMKLEHVLYSPSTQVTTLIDFDDVRFVPTTLKKSQTRSQYIQQWQQWQLFTLVAHVCDYQSFTKSVVKPKGTLFSPAGLASIACGAPGGSADLLSEAPTHFQSALHKCEFLTTTAHEMALWEDGAQMMEDTGNVYKRLATWSGLTS